MSDFLETNAFNGFATVFTAIVAISLYYWEMRKKKRDAAKIIVQEIRRAEDLVNEYKENQNYKFTKRIIVTNSWAKNIHHFVGDLAQDELDKISGLYSTGEYLDSIIAKVSDQIFKDQVQLHKDTIQFYALEMQRITQNQQSTSVGAQSGEQIVSQPQQIIKKVIPPIPSQPSWKPLLDEISYSYEPIYHSSICAKLKRIAKIK